MDEKIEVKVGNSNYENLTICCPSCKQTVIYNRVSDLKTVEPIAGKEVECLNCEKKIWIYGDTVTPLFNSLLQECEELFRKKNYMYCILNICQAYEVFFSQYIKIILVYEVFRGKERQLSFINFKNTLNLLLKNLSKTTFHPLRKIFLMLVLRPPYLKNVEEAIEKIENINNTDCFGMHYFDEYNSENRDQIIPYLRSIFDSNIGEKRNEVVHKSVYRPKKNEVELLFKEAKENIFNLECALRVNGDFLGSYFYTPYINQFLQSE